jgi:cobaltochelatase CobN
MHWTVAQPGCLDIERELVLIEQTPGEIVFLSAADTDLSCVASVWRERFGKRLRIAHAFSLRQPVAADHYIETVLRRSKLVVARLLGGRAYFAHFIQGVLDLKEEPLRPKFLIFSGTGSDDDELAPLSDFPAAVCRRMFEFFQHGGREHSPCSGGNRAAAGRSPRTPRTSPYAGIRNLQNFREARACHGLDLLLPGLDAGRRS